MFNEKTVAELTKKIKAANPKAKETELYTRYCEGPARAAFRDLFEAARDLKPNPKDASKKTA